jgi:glycosyltransferase involved in cell wall biosynthesis
MKIAYVTMQFPVASEAFAAVEIRAFRRLGAEVAVLTSRAAAAGAGAMLAERGLETLHVDHGGPAAGLRGLLQMARKPTDSLWLIAVISRHCWRRPLQLLKVLAAQLGIERQVTFAGHVAHAEVFRHLAEAEVALTLSQSGSERLPNAIKEAMLQRCLCLSTRTAGIEELIDDGKTGLLVDGGDPAGAARRLLDVLSDSAAVERIGRQAQAQIVAHFDVDRLMAERLQIWSALCQARSPGVAA